MAPSSGLIWQMVDESEPDVTVGVTLFPSKRSDLRVLEEGEVAVSETLMNQPDNLTEDCNATGASRR